MLSGRAGGLKGGLDHDLHRPSANPLRALKSHPRFGVLVVNKGSPVTETSVNLTG